MGEVVLMTLATLCYIQKNGRTLLLHRVKKENDIHRGKWNGLGGKFDPGESPEECVVREVKEESGLTVKHPILKGILTFPSFDGREDWRVFVFVAHEFKGRLKESPEGRLKWVRDSDLFKRPLWEGDLIFMRWLRLKGIFSAKFVYQRGRLLRHRVAFHK